jgi:alkylation response protein AidB-like acyl-CoA dehydrogenase
VDLRDRPEDQAFRDEVRRFLEEHLVGEFAELGGRGGSGDETYGFEVRRRWERVLAEGRWTCLGWPLEHGGRGASMTEQVIFNEEYARAGAPGRVNVMGEGLLGPTLIHYGTPEQKARFLPAIVAGDELWCQGYSEPDAGSDLANVKTRAVRDGDEWLVTGQKVWTSLAHQADWCFVVCRTDPESARHKGLSYLLVPMDQPGVEVRPITQLTRTSEFNEVFFDRARTSADNVVGAVGDGWRVALATLAFERGVALLGHQLSFRRELDRLVVVAEESGRAADPVVGEGRE